MKSLVSHNVRIASNILKRPVRSPRAAQYSSSGQGAILSILTAVQVLLFGLLTWWVRNHRVDSPEINLGKTLHRQQRPPARHNLLKIVSNVSGSPLLLNACALLAVVALWKKRLRAEALAITFCLLVGGLTRMVVHHMVQRPRPDQVLKEERAHKHSSSFPSGHVTTAVMFWGWFMIIGRNLIKKDREKRELLTTFPPILLLLNGITRVYLGEHWATDVLGGYLYGGACLSLSFLFYQRLRIQ